jgi:hypothetical protein
VATQDERRVGHPLMVQVEELLRRVRQGNEVVCISLRGDCCRKRARRLPLNGWIV